MRQDVAPLWLATQHAIAGRVAHEVKNTLNGVAVNLEVVRSRLGRPGALAAPAASFAETASEQFELLTEQVEALLALVRPVHAPADVAILTAQLVKLLGPAAEKEGATLVLAGAPDGAATTTGDGATARLAVAAALLAVLDATRAAGAVDESGLAVENGARREIRVAVEREGTGARLVVRPPMRGLVVLDDDVARVVADAGVRVAASDVELLLSFPPAPGGDDPTLGS